MEQSGSIVVYMAILAWAVCGFASSIISIYANKYPLVQTSKDIIMMVILGPIGLLGICLFLYCKSYRAKTNQRILYIVPSVRDIYKASRELLEIDDWYYASYYSTEHKIVDFLSGDIIQFLHEPVDTRKLQGMTYSSVYIDEKCNLSKETNELILSRIR